MGSYEPSDSLLDVEVMEGDVGDNSSYFDTNLCDNRDASDVCEKFVLEQFSCTEINTHFYDCERVADKQPIVKKGLALAGNYLLSNKEDVFSIPVEITSYQDKPADSVDSCIGQEEPLVSMNRSANLNVNTDFQEKTPVRNLGDNGICSTQSRKRFHFCCLESQAEACLGSVGPQDEDVVGSSAENVQIPIAPSSFFNHPGEHSRHNNNNYNDNAMDSLEAVDRDHHLVDEENQDLSDGEKTDLMIQTQHTEESSCVLVGRLPNLASGAGDDSTCRQLLVIDQEEDGCTGDPTCSNMVDSSRLPDTERKGNVKLDLVIISASSDAILSQPRRSTRPNKFCQKGETRKKLARRRKTVNKKLLPDEFFSTAVKRKRSCPCKRARSSIWGSLGNIIQVKENEVTQKVGNYLLQVENRRSHKKRVGSGNGSRRKANSSSSQAKKEESRAINDQSTHIVLKVKNGRQNGKQSLNVVESDVLDSRNSFLTAVKCVTKPGNPISMGYSDNENGTKMKWGDDLDEIRPFTSANGDLNNPVSCPGAFGLDSLHTDKDSESTVTQDTSVGNSFGDFPQGYFQTGTEVTNEGIGKHYSDPGTSPDSEVSNLNQAVNVGRDAGATTIQVAGSTDGAAPDMELMSLRKQKNSSKLRETAGSLPGFFAAEEKSVGRNKKKYSARHRREEKIGACHPTDTARLPLHGSGFRNSSNTERFTNESTKLKTLGESLKTGTYERSCKLPGQHGVIKSHELLVPKGSLAAGKTIGMPLSKSGVEVRKQRSAATVSASNRRKNANEQKEDRRKSINKKKVEEESLGQFVHNGENHRETGGGTDMFPGTADLSELRGPSELINSDPMGIEIPTDPAISVANDFAPEESYKSPVLSSALGGQFLPLPNAWVRCDDCYKWRCISTALADSIEATNCRWTCSDNMDKAYAACSIPQEKSNAEINRELELAEFSGEEDVSYAQPVAKGFEGKQITVPQQAPWKPIDSNLFLHRSRKTQTIDEIMICHCKPPLGGGLGCGDECLNRMLNIECVRGTCPCGDHCSNQQFQKRKYAKLEYFRCGKKGYGLQLLESVSQGDFLIEYVGEVLDLNAYEARQREYASRGQRHFYFMTLNGSEVIDACSQGNLGRFINHSCDPNCRTEKWMVNGEVCIGLFAIRNIKKGEEVTFDYNYVRVFGAAAKKCVCGSSECRGYIGGDPLNTDAVVQGDSDEEFPEPVTVDGDGEAEKVKGVMISSTTLSDGEKMQYTDQMVTSASSIQPFGFSTEKKEGASISGQALQPTEILLPNEDITSKPLSALQPPELSVKTEFTIKNSSSIKPLEVSLLKDNSMSKTMSTTQLPEACSIPRETIRKYIPDRITTIEKSTSDSVEDKPKISKAHSPAKSSPLSSSIKKGKCVSNPVIASKTQIHANKPKMLENAVNSRPRGVEEKLNELLDKDGGISKKIDATKGYLKLLFLTASSGDNVNGATVQSTRDLSIILDALLKTKKRNVLNDIINKNGLQMLHNIMKQNRKNFNRIPIIRKLLKILEYLAEKKILTLEHIKSGPPCVGVESFWESMIQLTRHNDVKVHQTARHFLDTWMPRTFRRNSYSDRDDINVEQQTGLHCNRFFPYKQWGNHSSRPMDDVDPIRQTALGAVSRYGDIQKNNLRPSIDSYPEKVNRTRKRKSRWDQPEGNFDQQSVKTIDDHKEKQKLAPSLQQPETRKGAHEQVDEVNHEKVGHGCDHNISWQAGSPTGVNAMHRVHDDAPPGFSSLPCAPYDASLTYSSNLSSDIHHRLCSCEVITGCLQERFISDVPVSYGIPMLFVDQLGTRQEDTMDSWDISPGIPFHPFPPLPPYPRGKSNRLPARMEHGESHPCASNYHQVDAGIPCTSGTRSPEVVDGTYNRSIVEQTRRSPPGNLGRRYFRQQKWNNSTRPWNRNRIGWGGFKAKNPRSNDEYNSVGVENVVKNRSEDVGGGGEDINSEPYQNPQHH